MSLEVLLASGPRRTLRLSPQPIGEGGQATVFTVDADPGVAVKLYHEPTPDLERRLESMLLLAHPDQFLSDDGTEHPALTWPAAMVKDLASGEVIGYTMRRVRSPEFVPLGTLFNAPQRRQHFADISWRFLLGLARNLAGLVASLHERELVLGDVSHGNIVVSQRGYLSLLDCDSMQFTDPRSGERFPCLFLTAEYAPPELQLEPAIERSPSTDDFSLAILVCRLLRAGDHTHIGVRLGGGDEDADVAANIRDGYSHLVRSDEMGLPPGTFDARLLPPPVLELAQRAFGPGHADPAARPSAEEWLAALDEAAGAVATCSASRYHAHGGHLAACPWCERVAAAAPDPFPGPGAAPAAVRPPAPSAGRHRFDWRWAFVALLLVGLILLVVLSSHS
jgi:DNA-binding helix-hairpin-helix protein with protein kinase domain